MDEQLCELLSWAMAGWIASRAGKSATRRKWDAILDRVERIAEDRIAARWYQAQPNWPDGRTTGSEIRTVNSQEGFQ